MSDVVKFPTPPQGQTGDDRKRASLDATRAVAKLSQLGRLEYERVRSKAAKELGCRVSFLDRVLENVHEEVSNFQHDYLLRSFAREEGERFVEFHEDSKVTPSWGLACATDDKTGEARELIVLADGNFTVVDSVRIKKPATEKVADNQ